MTEAIRPLIMELSQQSETRIHRLVGDAQAQITRLENEIQQVREQNRANPGEGRHGSSKNMMDQKVFSRIDKFKDESLKWKSLRTQVENLAELTYPDAGREVLGWARSIGASGLRYHEEGEVFNFMPQKSRTNRHTSSDKTCKSRCHTS